MERRLILIRHAEAEAVALSDKERALTQRGIRQVYLLSEWMQQHHFLPEHIIHSTALRCEQTARLLAERLAAAPTLQAEEQLYEASMRQIIETLVHVPATIHEVALIGHNPHLSYFAEWLSGEPLGILAPASAVAFHLPIDGWNMLSGQIATLLGRFEATH